MPTLKVRFPGGRYHATPWGHHVNEGLVEWPPSPWRLMRALLACGFASQGWTEVPPVATRLLEKLAAVLPSYQLPLASTAHSRHYMPTDAKPTLVFDTWANVGDGELLIHWPCELDAEESSLLGQLAAALGYLGRSESWVEAELVDEGVTEWNAKPCLEGELPARHQEQVSLMAAIPSFDYSNWRTQQVEAELAPFPLPEGKKKPTAKLLKDRAKVLEPFPANLIECLTKDTVWWKGHGWSQPPGSRRVLYWRPSHALEVSVPPAIRRSDPQPVEAILLSLTTQSGNRSSLPPITRTLPQAEFFHRAAISQLGKGERVHCPVLTGHDELGRPLHDHHEHTHTIPLDLDGDGRLDHILLYAKQGLDANAQRAIRQTRRTWAKGVGEDIQVAVVAGGSRDLLRGFPALGGLTLKAILGPNDGALVWESVTPFVLSKTLDRRSTRKIEGQVQAELASRLLPKAEQIEVLSDLSKGLRHFIRRRQRGGVPPRSDMGYALRIRLTDPIEGPLLLGYASHYGLGLFRSREDTLGEETPLVII